MTEDGFSFNVLLPPCNAQQQLVATGDDGSAAVVGGETNNLEQRYAWKGIKFLESQSGSGAWMQLSSEFGMGVLRGFKYPMPWSILTSPKSTGKMMGLRRFSTGALLTRAELVWSTMKNMKRPTLFKRRFPPLFFFPLGPQGGVYYFNQFRSPLLQVELSCTAGPLDATNIVSLYPLGMATAVIEQVGKPLVLQVPFSVISSLKVGVELQSKPPRAVLTARILHCLPLSDFCLRTWSVQDEPFTILRHKLSRVYSAPPAER
ncbi:LOW QUALITY PROTEIN: hypothetical protein RJ641_027378 [Dillenia turbinata]|uniref:Uncharacterized protein n=1 Tax=Dillenia turbinata TaxID=194707 RepID=A0AAN8ZLA0_9MAGN